VRFICDFGSASCYIGTKRINFAILRIDFVTKRRVIVIERFNFLTKRSDFDTTRRYFATTRSVFCYLVPPNFSKAYLRQAGSKTLEKLVSCIKKKMPLRETDISLKGSIITLGKNKKLFLY
jgi:hypothetical protein